GGAPYQVSIQVRKSTNLGVSFGSPVQVASLNSTTANGDFGLGFRSNGFPQVVANPMDSNQLFVAYADNPDGSDRADVFLVSSNNSGSSWSSPVKVNDDLTTRDQWQPA